jgi:hypothetical protein
MGLVYPVFVRKNRGKVYYMRKLVLALSFLAASAGVSYGAQAIESACRASARTKSDKLCSCIQDVADYLLVRQEQLRVATFFRDPDRAQELRMSDGTSNNAFWQRYEKFAAVATKVCVGS